MTNARMKAAARTLLISSALVLPMMAVAQPAVAAAQGQGAARINLNIPAQDLGSALSEFARQSNQQLLYSPELVKGKKSTAVAGSFSAEAGLRQLLSGTGIRVSTASSGAFLLNGGAPQGNVGIAASGGQDLSGSAVASGQVVDAGTGANLKGALVELEETGQTTSTDDLGSFRFPGLRPGTYTVRISYLGYQDIVASIEVGRGAGARQFAMTGGGDGQEIIVYGQRSARAQALNQERTAENVQTIVSGDLLGNFTGTTLPESLRRVPGVTFQRDAVTGDGTNIMVRGLAPDFSTVKLNGVELPEGSGTGRSASLGNILTESISKVTISKTLLPNQDSSGTGGLIEIETKTPLDRPRRYASFTLEGAKRARGFNDELIAAGTVSGLFGSRDQFGLSASVQYRKRDIKRVQYSSNFFFGQYLPLQVDGTPSFSSTNFIDPRTEFPFESQADEVYPYSLNIARSDNSTENLTITLSGAWNVNRNTRLFLDYQRIDQEDSEFFSTLDLFAYMDYALQPVASLGGQERQALGWRFGNALSNSLSASLSPSNKMKTDVYSLRGESDVGKLNFKVLGGYAKGTTTKENYFLGISAPFLFFTDDQLLPEAIHPIEGRPISPFPIRLPGDNSFIEPLFNDAGFDLIHSTEELSFGSLRHTTNKGSNVRYNGDASVRFQADERHLKYIEVGASYKSAKFADATPLFHFYFPTSILSLSDIGVSLSQSSLSDVGINSRLGQFSREDVEPLVTGFVPSMVDGGMFMRFDFSSDPRTLEEFTKEGEQAGYLQGALTFGKLEVVGGVRASKIRIRAVNLAGPRIFDATGQQDVAFYQANNGLLEERASQTDYLPRMLVNYRANDNMVLRTGYYLSVARPQIALLSRTPGVFLFQQPIFGPSNNQPLLQVSKGNPDLKPARTHNFDASAEYYDRNVGVLKLGAFYKRINNLLESSISTGTGVLADVTQVLPSDPRFQDVVANPSNYHIVVTFPKNNPDPANIWGIEATVEKQFTFLPGLWSGFGVYANYTHTRSSKKQPMTWANSPVTDSNGNVIGYETEQIVVPGVQFDGQARHSGTFGITYNRNGIDANIAYTRQSRRQLGFRSFNLHDYEEAYGTLDVRAEYRTKRFGPLVRFYVEGADLLRGPNDASIEKSLGKDDGTTGKYFYDARYFGGRQVRVGISTVF